MPRDLWLAERVVQNRALTRAILEPDLTVAHAEALRELLPKDEPPPAG